MYTEMVSVYDLVASSGEVADCKTHWTPLISPSPAVVSP